MKVAPAVTTTRMGNVALTTTKVENVAPTTTKVENVAPTTTKVVNGASTTTANAASTTMTARGGLTASAAEDAAGAWDGEEEGPAVAGTLTATVAAIGLV